MAMKIAGGRLFFCRWGEQMTTSKMTRQMVAGTLAVLCALPVAGAHADDLGAALAETKPLIDLRARAEFVDQDGFANDARAYTLRERVGFETGSFYGFSLLAEIESVQALGPEDFNSTANGRTAYPVVADPEASELNRLQLTYEGIPGTKIVAGRQRIILDDARFVGNVGWRQNEQTFDAALISNSTLPGVTATYAYIEEVHRIFSDKSPIGNFDSDSHLINLGYSGIEGLTLTGFAYLLDFDNAAGASSETYGARAAYKTALNEDWSLKGAASYARQSEYGSNPASFSLDYYSVDAGASYGPLSFGAGYEVLEGDGTTGFSTPLATLHKFQGWADAFLTTPVDGIEDLSASLTYALPAFGPFTKITSGIVFHDFEAERTGASLGDEVDAVLSAALDNGIKLTAKYASFDGGSAGPADREKLWFQVAYTY